MPAMATLVSFLLLGMVAALKTPAFASGMDRVERTQQERYTDLN